MATVKKTTTDEQTVTQTTKSFEEMTLEEKKAYMEEPVEIELFYDGDKYVDDVHIQINDQDWLIQRGVKVTVPRKVQALIADNEQLKSEALRNQRGLAARFAADTSRFIG